MPPPSPPTSATRTALPPQAGFAFMKLAMNAEPASVPGDGPPGFGEPAVIKTNNQHTELRDHGMPVSPQPSYAAILNLGRHPNLRLPPTLCHPNLRRHPNLGRHPSLRRHPSPP